MLTVVLCPSHELIFLAGSASLERKQERRLEKENQNRLDFFSISKDLLNKVFLFKF